MKVKREVWAKEESGWTSGIPVDLALDYHSDSSLSVGSLRSKDEEGVKSGPWVGKGNPAGFLDSEDERELEENAEREARRRRSKFSGTEFKDIASFLLEAVGPFLGMRTLQEENT